MGCAGKTKSGTIEVPLFVVALFCYFARLCNYLVATGAAGGGSRTGGAVSNRGAVAGGAGTTSGDKQTGSQSESQE